MAGASATRPALTCLEERAMGIEPTTFSLGSNAIKRSKRLILRGFYRDSRANAIAFCWRFLAIISGTSEPKTEPSVFHSGIGGGRKGRLGPRQRRSTAAGATRAVAGRARGTAQVMQIHRQPVHTVEGAVRRQV